MQHIRLTLILLFGAVPALALSMFAGAGLIMGVLSLFGSQPLMGVAVVAISSLGLFGVYSILATPWGAAEKWQRWGLLAGIFAACMFVFFDFSTARMTARHEPNSWVMSPIAVAAFLLLEYYIKVRRTDENAPGLE